jgi:hypothetical protein
LNEKIKHGPDLPETMPSEYERQKSSLLNEKGEE